MKRITQVVWNCIAGEVRAKSGGLALDLKAQGNWLTLRLAHSITSKTCRHGLRYEISLPIKRGIGIGKEGRTKKTAKAKKEGKLYPMKLLGLRKVLRLAGNSH